MTQSEVFFGDMVDKCYKCVVKQGHTLFVPTGKAFIPPSPLPIVDPQSRGVGFLLEPLALTWLEIALHSLRDNSDLGLFTALSLRGLLL